MIRVLRICHHDGLHQVIELLAALAEGIHLAREKIEQRIVAVPAVEVENAVVLVMIVLAVARAEDVHAEGDLVLAAQNIHVVGPLEAGDREPAERAGAAPDGEAAVVNGQLQEVLGALVQVCDAERSGVDAVRVGAAIVAPAARPSGGES